MTESTGNAGGSGPFETRFSIGAAVVSALALLLAIAFGAIGYQGSTLPVAGTELDILTGMVGLVGFALVAVVALVVAVYMEPGFDR